MAAFFDFVRAARVQYAGLHPHPSLYRATVIDDIFGNAAMDGIALAGV